MNTRALLVFVLLLTIVSLSIAQVSTKTISGHVRTTGGVGISGVTMAGFPIPTVTDVLGDYSTTVQVYVGGSAVFGWSGTVIPVKTGYLFVPDSIVYTDVTTNLTNQNYAATLETFTIAGYVLSSSGTAIGGVVISGLPGNPSTDTKGYYSAIVTYGLDYTATPSKSGYSFVPAFTTYKHVVANQSTDYLGIVLSYSISGYVRTAAGGAIEGVQMNGLPNTPSTDSTGFYIGSVNVGWSGTVTPMKQGFSISPPSTIYTSVTSDKTTDYIGTSLLTYAISGSVRTAPGSGISGVLMSGLPGNPLTDANGNYSGEVASGWSGTVMPTKAGYGFTPSSVTYSDVTSNRLNQDYQGALQPKVIISGYVRTATGTPILGVLLNGLPTPPTTNADGYYADSVSSGWTGTVTPTKPGFSFIPSSAAYISIATSQVRNYTGTPLQSYAVSGYVRTQAGTGIEGVVLSGLPLTPSTNANGYYLGTVWLGWSGIVTPTKPGYSFSPTSTTYGNVSSDMAGNYAGTPTTAVGVTEGTIPTSYRLMQNFPNPFNPSTAICYSLPSGSSVRLRVFSSLGQEVATIVEATQSEGTYSVRFDASGLGSGIYFYRLIARSVENGNSGLFTETKKLILVR